MNAGRGPEFDQFDAFSQGQFNFMRIGRHLFAVATVPHLDFGRSLAESRHGDVDSGIAATDNDHVRPDSRIFSGADGRQEIHATDHEILIVARNAKALGILQTDCQQCCIVSLVQKFSCLPYRVTEMDFDAQLFDHIDFSVQFIFGQAVIRNAITHDAAGMFAFIEYFDFMAFLRQIISGGKAGGAATDNGDFFAGWLGFFQIGFDVGTTGCDVFHRTDENGGTADGVLHAFVFARAGQIRPQESGRGVSAARMESDSE